MCLEQLQGKPELGGAQGPRDCFDNKQWKEKLDQIFFWLEITPTSP